MSTYNLLQKIVQLFNDKKGKLKNNLNKGENALLKSLEFKKCCSLKEDSSSEGALFGYGSLKSDYKPKDDGNNLIIEVKYIRKTDSSHTHNEYDIKNALSQIIEQAVCKKVENAILLIIDAGRACNRPWNAIEGKFISMFQQNPFKIKLIVLRIRILKCASGDIKIEHEII